MNVLPSNDETGRAARTAKIAAQNDAFRTGLASAPSIPGRVVMTAAVVANGADFMQAAAQAVTAFSEFTEDNDPWGEHDFGAFELDGERLFWKIDLYNPDLSAGSSEPSNPDVTHRVLTIMLASDY